MYLQSFLISGGGAQGVLCIPDLDLQRVLVAVQRLQLAVELPYQVLLMTQLVFGLIHTLWSNTIR